MGLPVPAAVGSTPSGPRRSRAWLMQGLVGAAILAALALLVVQRDAERELARALQRANPGWLALGVLLQVGTYAADARIWSHVLARAGEPRPFGQLLRQSLAKYFVDQVLPTAGVSGTVLVVGALGRSGVSRATCAAALVLRLVTHFLSYGMVLALALATARARGHFPPALLAIPALFAGGLVGAALLLLVLLRRPTRRVPARLARLRLVRAALETAAAATPALAQAPGLLLRSLLLQLSVFALDTATLWTSLAAVGVRTGPQVAFVGLLLASVVRSAGGVPGGVGTFEAACVAVLAAMGVSLGPALLATLVFRALSFWLPLFPGMVLARRLARS